MIAQEIERLRKFAESEYRSDPGVTKVALEALESEFKVLRIRNRFNSPYASRLHKAIIERFEKHYVDSFHELIWAIIVQDVDGFGTGPSAEVARRHFPHATFTNYVRACAGLAFANLFPVVKREVEELTGSQEELQESSETEPE